MPTDTETGTLGTALGALAELEPPPDSWARIEARLAGRRQSAVSLSLATIAVIALTVAVGVGIRVRHPPATSTGAPATAAPQATERSGIALKRRSFELEQVLAQLPARRATRASTGFTAALLEDRIAAVDDRLSDAPAAADASGVTEALWRERVLLLDSLVRVRYAAAVDPT